MMLRAIAIGLLISTCAFAQEKFDVASVRKSTLVGEGSRRERIVATPGSLAMYNVTLHSAVQWAYSVKEYQVTGPAWIGDERYDISAKAGDAAGEARMRVMLQSLLADRMSVAVHREKKETAVYALVVAKGGIKMKPGDPNGPSVLQEDKMTLNAHDTSVGEIAETLSRANRMIPGLPWVIDMTGLSGRYNFTVDASALMQGINTEAGKGAADLSGLIPAVQEMLEKQLGLRAELRKAPIEFVVVDRAEKTPTAN